MSAFLYKMLFIYKHHSDTRLYRQQQHDSWSDVNYDSRKYNRKNCVKIKDFGDLGGCLS
jgi:hypothetical protein